MHFLADEMADVHVALDVELGQNVELAGDVVDFRGDLRLRQRAGDRIGLAELAFDLNEKRLHRRLPELLAPLASTSTSRSWPDCTVNVA